MTKPDRTPSKRWNAGTLCYTASLLTTVCCLLLLGTFADSLKVRSMGPILQLVLRNLGISNQTIMIFVTSVPSLLAIFGGPLVCCWSDRFRSRLGRRLPFLLVSTPVSALAMAGLAFSPRLGPALAAAAELDPGQTTVLLLLGCWIVYQLTTIVNTNLFTALINDILPQAILGRFFGLYRMVSLAAGMLMGWYGFGLIEGHYLPLMLGITALYGFLFFGMCLALREGEYPAPETESSHAFGRFAGLRDFFVNCFADSYYRTMFLFLTLASMTMNSFGVFVLLYAKELGVDPGYYGKAQAIMLGTSFALSFLQGMLADRFHPLRLTVLALGVYSAVILAGYFIIIGPWTLLGVFIAQGILAGFYGTFSMSLPLRLMPRDCFGQFNSASASVIALVNIFYIPLIGKLIDATGNRYQYAMLVCAGVGGLAVLSGLFLYRRFRQLGGEANYVAPPPRSQRNQPI